jgi:hypothetical protein
MMAMVITNLEEHEKMMVRTLYECKWTQAVGFTYCTYFILCKFKISQLNLATWQREIFKPYPKGIHYFFQSKHFGSFLGIFTHLRSR